MKNKHKELVKNLTDFYASRHPNMLRSSIKDIVIETMVQTSLLSIDSFVNYETKNALYKMAVKGLSVN